MVFHQNTFLSDWCHRYLISQPLFNILKISKNLLNLREKCFFLMFTLWISLITSLQSSIDLIFWICFFSLIPSSVLPLSLDNHFTVSLSFSKTFESSISYSFSNRARGLNLCIKWNELFQFILITFESIHMTISSWVLTFSLLTIYTKSFATDFIYTLNHHLQLGVKVSELFI